MLLLGSYLLWFHLASDLSGVHSFTGITVQSQILQKNVCHGAIVTSVKRSIYPSISFQNAPKQASSSCLPQEPCHSGGMI